MSNFQTIGRELRRLCESLAVGQAKAGGEELRTLVDLMNQVLAEIERTEERLKQRDRELEKRLVAIEHSRFWRLVRLPGRWYRGWRGRLGHRLLRSPLHGLVIRLAGGAQDPVYQAWVERERSPAQSALPYKPKFSILMPVYQPHMDWLSAAVQSVFNQTYGNWELYVSEDGPSSRAVERYLARLGEGDTRVRYLRSAGKTGIAMALNRAVAESTGDYVVLLDQDDLLRPWSLYAVAEAVQEGKVGLVYSDEDYIDEVGQRLQPILKPAFSPDLLYSCMYLGHLLVLRRELVEKVRGFRAQFDGAQDYDLVLRAMEHAPVVRHVPRILYHWRRHGGSTAWSPRAKPFAEERARQALAMAVARQDPDAKVERTGLPNVFRVRWSVPANVKASVVICSRIPRLLRQCVSALRAITTFPKYEVIVVEHRPDALLSSPPWVGTGCDDRLVWQGAFNFSAMNNEAARRSTGQVLVFLNDDVAPLRSEWLTALIGQALRPGVGIVGALLLYPSRAIQHAGMVLGMGPLVGHVHRYTSGSRYWGWAFCTRNVSAVTGACLCIRRDLFDELGGFDEGFPVHFGDVDLCLRAWLKGYRVIVETAAVLIHRESQTGIRSVTLDECERFVDRWGALLAEGDRYYNPNLSVADEDPRLAFDPEVWANLRAR